MPVRRRRTRRRRLRRPRRRARRGVMVPQPRLTPSPREADSRGPSTRRLLTRTIRCLRPLLPETLRKTCSRGPRARTRVHRLGQIDHRQLRLAPSHRRKALSHLSQRTRPLTHYPAVMTQSQGYHPPLRTVPLGREQHKKQIRLPRPARRLASATSLPRSSAHCQYRPPPRMPLASSSPRRRRSKAVLRDLPLPAHQKSLSRHPALNSCLSPSHSPTMVRRILSSRSRAQRPTDCTPSPPRLRQIPLQPLLLPPIRPQRPSYCPRTAPSRRCNPCTAQAASTPSSPPPPLSPPTIFLGPQRAPQSPPSPSRAPRPSSPATAPRTPSARCGARRACSSSMARGR